MVIDTKISELPELNVSLIDETTFMPVVIGIDPVVNRSVNVKEFVESIVIQGQTGLTETDPVYTSEKNTLALKTDLNKYSLSGHTHSQYLTGYTETEPAYNASVAKNITTGDTANWNAKQAELVNGINIKTINDQSILGEGNLDITGITMVEVDPIYEAEKHLYSLTGHTHSQYLTGETEPAYNADKASIALKTDLNGYSVTGHTHGQYLTGETDPVYESEKDTLALKTDLDNYSLTGHTHNQYLTGFTELDPVYEAEKHLYSQTGHTHNQYLTGFTENDPIYESEKHLYITGETDPIYQNEKSTLALKTDLSNYVPSTGGTISGNVTIAGDLIVTGSTYETDVETLKIGDAYIVLRNGAIGGLADGEYTGIEAVNYNGINSGRLVFDNTGTARVGDVGSEQPLATREETPTDDGIAIWNSLTNKFETVTLKLSDVSLTGHTHNQYLTTETDPVYLSEKSTLALKTDLDNYSLTGHTHSQYLTEFTETDPVYESEKSTLALKTDLEDYLNLSGGTVSGSVTATSFIKTGGNSSQFLMADGSVTTGSTQSASSLWTTITGTRIDNTMFILAGDFTSFVGKGMIFKWTQSGIVKCAMVSLSSYTAPDTMVTIVGDLMYSIDANSLKYCMLPTETIKFAIAGTIGSTGTNVANTFYANQPYRVLGGDLQLGTAGAGNSLVIDINKAGTTMFTSKLGLNAEAFNFSTFKANSETSLIIGNKVTIDIDAVHTYPGVDLYVQLYLFPTRILYQL